MNKPVGFLVASLYLVASYPGPAAGEAVVAYEFGGEWGGEGSGEGYFKGLNAVAVSLSGNIVYTLESTGRRVQYFKSNGEFLGAWGEAPVPDGTSFLFTGAVGGPDDMINWPYDICVGPGNRVYVADPGPLRIKYYTAFGSFLGGWERATRSNGEWTAVAAAPDGKVYVTDYDENYVRYFEPAGEPLGLWCGGANPTFEPQDVGDLAVGPDGTVYLTACYEDFVQRFTAEGQFLVKWGTGGEGPGEFSSPVGIAIDADGTVYVADNVDGGRTFRVQFFNREGDFKGEFRCRSKADKKNTTVESIAVAPDGTLYVADGSNERIIYFRRAETVE